VSSFVQAVVLAATKTPAEEGFDIILVMLVVGLIFLSVIALGEIARHFGHKRAARRAQHRSY
jgi:K+-transporting ATPase A subunit